MNHSAPEKQGGKRIAELRTERKLSQAKLADLMKAHPSGRYANWRQGMIDKTGRGTRPLRVNEIADTAGRSRPGRRSDGIPAGNARRAAAGMPAAAATWAS